MSAVGDAFAALKNVILLHERMDAIRNDTDRMADDLRALTEKVYGLNERVARIETMVEIATGRGASPTHRLPKK